MNNQRMWMSFDKRLSQREAICNKKWLQTHSTACFPVQEVAVTLEDNHFQMNEKLSDKTGINTQFFTFFFAILKKHYCV